MTKKKYIKPKLSPMQDKFVHNLVKGMTQEKAYIKAGYKAKSAAAGASTLLRNPKVIKELAIRKSRAAKLADVTAANIIREYARIGFFDVRKLYNKNGELKKIQDIDDDTAAALAGLEALELAALTTDKVKAFTKKYKIADKIRALDSLAKIEGLFEKDHAQRGQSFTEGLNGLLEAIDGKTRSLSTDKE